MTQINGPGVTMTGSAALYNGIDVIEIMKGG